MLKSRRPVEKRTSGAKQAAVKLRLSPEGTAELSPGRQSWVNRKRGNPVPLGTGEILCMSVQPSLTALVGSLIFHPGLTSWAKFSRPFGTQAKFFSSCKAVPFVIIQCSLALAPSLVRLDCQGASINSIFPSRLRCRTFTLPSLSRKTNTSRSRNSASLTASSSVMGRNATESSERTT
jgi:hypothetical protein